jgi:hypothetical protein
MTDMTCITRDFASRQQERRTERLKELERLKSLSIPILRAAGITAVEVHFDGYGDSGAIEVVDYLSADGSMAECPKGEIDRADGESTMTLSEALDDLAYIALELHHPGWEINEGSSGALEIDVTKSTFILECRTRFIDYDVHSDEI